jgi:predicted CoA-binding protein
MNVNDTDIRKILTDYKRITVLGLSPDSSKPSNQIPVYMKSKGYEVVGVYPKGSETAGLRVISDRCLLVEHRKYWK